MMRHLQIMITLFLIASTNIDSVEGQEVNSKKKKAKSLGISLSQTGQFSGIGSEAQLGINLGKELLKEDENLRDIDLNITILDNKSSISPHMKNLDKLVYQYKVDSIIGLGGFFADSTIQMIEKVGIPYLALLASSQFEETNFKWSFAMGPSYWSTIEAICRNIERMKLKKILVIIDEGWDDADKEIVKQKASKFGIEKLTFKKLPTDSKLFDKFYSEIENQISKANLPVQGIIATNKATERSSAVLQKLIQKIPFYATTIGNPIKSTELKERLRVPVPPWVVAAVLPGGDIKKSSLFFIQNFEKKYSRPPGLFSGYAWDALNIMVKAKQKDCKRRRKRIKDFLEKTQEVSGVNGWINMGMNHIALHSHNLIIAEIRNGRYQIFKTP